MFKSVNPNKTVIISKNDSHFIDNNIVTDLEFYSYEYRSTPGVSFTFQCTPQQEYTLTGNIDTDISCMVIVSSKKCRNVITRKDATSGKLSLNCNFKSENKQVYIYVLISGGQTVFNRKVTIKELKVCPTNQLDLILKTPVIKPELKAIDNIHYSCSVNSCELENETYKFLHFNTECETGIIKPELTVALPIFRGKDSVWLAFEGLVRQKNVTFPWELVVAEEDLTINSGCFGIEEIIPYLERLKAVGCVSIKYCPMDRWVPLSKKWCLLGKMSEDTMCFLIHSADSYSGHCRLVETYTAFKTQTPIAKIMYHQGIFYNIFDGYHAEYTQKTGHGIFSAFRTEMIKYITPRVAHSAKLVDGWLNGNTNPPQGMNKKKTYIITPTNNSWGMETQGWNTLGRGRDLSIKKRGFMWKDCEVNINKVIPKEILQKLESCKGKKYNNFVFNCSHKFSHKIIKIKK